MTNRIFVPVSSAFAATLIVLAARSASAGGQTGALVRLQPATPGAQQLGHTNINGTARAGQFVGGGAGVTSLNASNLNAGVVPDARLFVGGEINGPLSAMTVGAIGGNRVGVAAASSGDFLRFDGSEWLPSVNGTSLTNLSASNLATGTVADARLSSNVVLLGGTQTITGAKAFSTAPSFTAAGAPMFVTSATLVQNLNADRLDGISGENIAQLAQPNNWTGANTFSNAGNSFTGAGSGLTALNATNVASGTLNFARFPTAGVWPVTSLDIDSSTLFIDGINHRVGIGTTAPSANRKLDVQAGAVQKAIHAETSSTFGVAVDGEATSGTGFTVGGSFLSASTDGIGAFGSASASTGTTYGGKFETNSSEGLGVSGAANSVSGSTIAGFFRNFSSSGFGGYFQNLPLGQTSDVELSGPNGAINTKGFVHREYATNTPSVAIPIAYGSIRADGFISGGTGNFTVVHGAVGKYDIQVSGENYNESTFVVTATPASSTLFFVTVSDSGATFRVNTFNSGGAVQDVRFHFTIWVANPAAGG